MSENQPEEICAFDQIELIHLTDTEQSVWERTDAIFALFERRMQAGGLHVTLRRSPRQPHVWLLQRQSMTETICEDCFLKGVKLGWCGEEKTIGYIHTTPGDCCACCGCDLTACSAEQRRMVNCGAGKFIRDLVTRTFLDRYHPKPSQEAFRDHGSARPYPTRSAVNDATAVIAVLAIPFAVGCLIYKAVVWLTS